MNEPQTNFDASSEPALKELQGELQSLRTLLVATLAILFLISICLNVYLRHQAVAVGNQAAGIQRSLSQFETMEAPRAAEFWTKLLDYSKTHPDFSPIVQKYAPHIFIPQPAASNVPPKK
jgi:hypothetical protein